MNDAFAFLYDLTGDSVYGRRFWGDDYCGPNRLEHGVETLIVKKDKRGGDGQPVEIYCTALPSRFYKINILPSLNSIGEPMTGWSMTTGTGQEKLIKALADAVVDGMVGVQLCEVPA